MSQNKFAKPADPPESKEDHSLLIKPINVGLSGAHHVLQSIRNGTAEVRDLLLNECDLIYECRMCRSLHRSLANFLAHKRVYCTQHCCESMVLFSQSDVENETVIVQPESPDSGAAVNEDDAMGDEPDGVAEAEASVQKEVLTAPAKIFRASSAAKDRSKPKSADGLLEDDFHAKCARHLDNRNASRTQVTIKLEPIDSSPVAMLQAVVPSVAVAVATAATTTTTTTTAFVKATAKAAVAAAIEAQVAEPVEKPNHAKTSQRPKTKVDIAAPPPAAPAGSKRYSCAKCGSPFSSMKSMSFHLKNIHAKRRVYYHCPYCKSAFSQVYGVTRHLMSVHKKSKEQVSRLRGKIQKSALSRLPPAADKGPAEAEDRRNRAQASPIQSSTVRLTKSLSIHRCSGCDKIFTDKRTLDSHSRKCPSTAEGPRSSARSKSSDARAPAIREKPGDRPRRAVVKRREEGDGAAVKVPSVVERRIMEIVDLERLSCVHCDKSFMNASNLRRHAAAHIGWNRFKCRHCDYQSYSRSDCRSHVKRKHVNKRRLHKQLDSFVVDLPADEVEKNVQANGDFRPAAEKDVVVGDARSKRASEGSGSCEDHDLPWSKPPRLAAGQPPAGFNISTRLSPRTFDTSPYRRSDSESALVTRSGSYPKTERAACRREPRPDPDNQKVLRTKVIRLKPPPPPPPPPASCCPSPDSSPKTNGCGLFSNYDDHNYSVEVKFDRRPEDQDGRPEDRATDAAEDT